MDRLTITIKSTQEKDVQLRTKGVFRPVTRQIGNSLGDIQDYYKEKRQDGVTVVPSDCPPHLNRVKKALLHYLQPGSFLFQKNLVTGTEAAEPLLVLMDSLALAMDLEVLARPSEVVCDVLLAVCNQPVFVLTLVESNLNNDELKNYNNSVAREATGKLKMFMDERVCVVSGVCCMDDIEKTDTFYDALKEHARISSFFIPLKTFETPFSKFNSIVTAFWASVAETTSVISSGRDKHEEIKRFLTRDQCVLLVENINKREVTVQHEPITGATTLMLEVARRLSRLNDTFIVCSTVEEKDSLSLLYKKILKLEKSNQQVDKNIVVGTDLGKVQVKTQHQCWTFVKLDEGERDQIEQSEVWKGQTEDNIPKVINESNEKKQNEIMKSSAGMMADIKPLRSKDAEVGIPTCDENVVEKEEDRNDGKDGLHSRHTSDEEEEGLDELEAAPFVALRNESEPIGDSDLSHNHQTSDDEEEEAVDHGTAAVIRRPLMDMDHFREAIKKSTIVIGVRGGTVASPSVTAGVVHGGMGNTSIDPLMKKIDDQSPALRVGAIDTSSMTEHPFYVIGVRGETVASSVKAGVVHGGMGNTSSSFPTSYRKQRPLVQKGRQMSKADIMKRTISHFKVWNEGKVKTAALEQVLNKLKMKTTWLTIKGNPGEGKTTVGYMALEEMYKRGRYVFEVRSTDEFREIISSCLRPVIMLDDAFGYREFDKAKWSYWLRVLIPLFKSRKHNSHQCEDETIILTGRTDVLNSAPVNLGRLSDFLTLENHVVLMDHHMERDLEEKRAILRSFSDSFGFKVDTINIENIIRKKLHLGFPQLCHLFTQIYKQSNLEENTQIAEDFFVQPMMFLNESIRKLSEGTNNKMLFKEMLKGEGKVSRRQLRELHPTNILLEAAQSLIGTFLKVEEDDIIFDHQSIYDSVAYTMCLLDPSFIIKQCPLSIIHERVRLQLSWETKCKTSSECSLVVYVPMSYAEDLAERFATEIMSQKLIYTLSHQAFTDKTFVSKVMAKINIPLKRLLHWTDEDSSCYTVTFLSLVPSSKSPELLQYIDNCPDIQLTEEDEHSVLYGTCVYAASQVLSYLTKTRESMNINVQLSDQQYPFWQTKKTPLMIAAETKDIQFVDQILSLKPDPNVKDYEKRTALHFLCQVGLISVVAKVIDNGAYIDDKDLENQSPLCYACRHNHLDIATLLIERGARVDEETLEAACRGGNLSIVKMLIERGVRGNDTSLTAACVGGNLDLVELLIEKGARVDEETLEAACRGGNLSIVKMLIERGVRGNDTSLTAACVGGNLDLVELLIERGARVDEETLEAACRGGNLTIVKMLIERGVRVNDTSLTAACVGGNLDLVELLIERGARVDEETLEAACRGGNLSIVKMLIERGVRVNDTSLTAACVGGNLDLVELLIERGARVDEETLSAACRGGNLDLIDFLFGNGNNLNGKNHLTICNSDGIKGFKMFTMTVLLDRQDSLKINVPSCYLLHAACKNDKPQAIKWLLQQDPACRRGEWEGDTALHTAAWTGSKECVDLLLRAGAEVNIQNKEGESALHRAVARGPSGDDLLLNTSFHKAEGRGSNECPDAILTTGAAKNLQKKEVVTETESFECVDLLLKAGAAVDTQNNKGDTALHSAAERGSLECVDLLLKAGAAVNVQTKKGDTAIHSAGWRGSKECVELLLKAGAAVDTQNNKGDTALHRAAERGSVECVELLLKAGAAVDTQNNKGDTALPRTSETGFLDCVQMLPKVDAAVNVQNKEGDTALHSAGWRGSKECVELLLKAGAAVDTQNNKGDTALHRAAERGSVECVDLLLKIGAALNVPNAEGYTASHIIERSRFK